MSHINEMRRLVGLRDSRLFAPQSLVASILALWLMFGATASQASLLSFFDSADAQQKVLSLFIKATPAPRYSIAGSGSVEAEPIIKKNKKQLLRGMKPVPEASSKGLEPKIKVLSETDEKNYRKLFTALNDGRLQDADSITADIKDGTLLGAAEAAYILNPRNAQVSFDHILGWLSNYGDLPQAQDVYKKALSMRVSGAPELKQPPRIAVQETRIPSNSAEPLEWKKPRGFTVEALWRSGKWDEAAEKLKDVQVAEHAPEEAYYPLWLKGLIAFSKADYNSAAESFAVIANGEALDASNRAAGAFWAARVYEKLGDSDKQSQFMDMAARTPRSFYGLMALAYKNEMPEEMGDTIHFTKRDMDALKASPAGLRALAFLQIGEKELAEKEVLTLTSEKGLSASLLALSSQFELPGAMMRLSGARSSANKYMKMASFPPMPWQPRGGFTSDPSLVAAIAWNESKFNSDAHNPSGASGIMQIMPDTAERVMAGSSGSLFNPQVSVTLGDKYIKSLSTMKGIDGSLLHIIAGYNCGPGKIQQLFAGIDHNNDPLLFLEAITLKETHDYVQKVLMTYAAYRMRAGKPDVALADLSHGNWPNFEVVKTASR